MKKFFKEFLEFANRGNVMDLAIAVILGGAVNAIVKSLVDDLFMPLFSIFIGRVDIASLEFVVTSRLLKGKPIIFKYGDFLNNVLTFLIYAFCIFLIVKFIAWLKKFSLLKKEEPADPEEPVAPPTTEELLADIRDLLRAQAQNAEKPGPSDSPDGLESEH